MQNQNIIYLKKLCHAGLDPVSNALTAKRGAMFGLDARIALAIFGALSVISGAALYSAIQESKVVAVITEMNEIGKAWESYYLDTAKNLDPYSVNSTLVDFYIFKGEGLVKDLGYLGWNGPYLPYDLGTGAFASDLMYPKENALSAYIGRFATSVDWSLRAESMCTSGRSCAIWIRLSKFNNESIVLAIDEKVDGSDGASKGRFRWSGVAGDQDINLMYAPIKNPND